MRQAVAVYIGDFRGESDKFDELRDENRHGIRRFLPQLIDSLSAGGIALFNVYT
jgi:hypothetical protein